MESFDQPDSPPLEASSGVASGGPSSG